MKKNYISVVTAKGREKIAKAAAEGEKVVFAWMAVGDGNGLTPEPDENSQALIHEVFRSPLNSVKIVSEQKNIIATEMIIPPEAGGFTIREGALYDEDGECLVVASLPVTCKPELSEGSGRFTVIRIWLSVDNVGAIELSIDPGIIMATVEDVLTVENNVKDYTDGQVNDHAESRNHPDATLTEKGFTRLSSATDSNDEDKAATPKAIKTAIAEAIRGAWEADNPIGTVRFFSQALDPNERWPWSEWVYTGENKTIRVGKADGSNVGQAGGSDNFTLQRANLPAVRIDVNGETSELPAHELTTRGAGRHKHQGGMAAPGEVWDGDYIVGSDNDSHRTRNNTSEADDHTHVIDVQAHKHNTTGKTDNLGEGASFSVVEAHTLLMCWSRVA
ncbi:phage tail protein [Raoultella planticola]|uniref:phage tail protein n=1 Tax=Raoultella planticola TaxID=575 RepID=UPI00115725FC|nr:phage tail protein [Raoultella planticola]